MTERCDRIQSLIPLAARGDLDESARAEVARHAEACPHCAPCWQFQLRLQEALTQDPLAAPPPVYFEGMLEEIHRRMPVRARSEAPRRRRIAPQHAATLMMAALAMLWVGASLGPAVTGLLPPLGFKGMGIHAAAPRMVAAAAPEKPLVLIKGYGLVSTDSELLRMTPEMRRELGLPVEKTLAMAEMNDKLQIKNYKLEDKNS